MAWTESCKQLVSKLITIFIHPVVVQLVEPLPSKQVVAGPSPVYWSICRYRIVVDCTRLVIARRMPASVRIGLSAPLSGIGHTQEALYLPRCQRYHNQAYTANLTWLKILFCEKRIRVGSSPTIYAPRSPHDEARIRIGMARTLSTDSSCNLIKFVQLGAERIPSCREPNPARGRQESEMQAC